MAQAQSAPISQPPPHAELVKTAETEAVWSETADRLKWRLDVARKSTFFLSILGAVLATLASQKSGDLRQFLAIFGAAPLGLASFITAQFLGSAQVTGWVRARAASEALKREAWSCAAGGGAYQDFPQRDARLRIERERIERDVDDLIGLTVTAPRAHSAIPQTVVSRGQYIDQRVHDQIDRYYLPRAEQHGKVSSALRWLELSLSMFAALVAAAIGFAGKEAFGSIDFIAFTAVLTTIGGAIVAHVEASRYDFLVATYRATARRLKNELVTNANFVSMSDAEWAAFVQRCETIIADQNGSWLSKWTRAS